MDYSEFVAMICDSLGLDPQSISGETSFLTDLGIDSLTLANFIIKLEHRFSIKIDLANVWELKNVNEAYARFQQALNLKKNR